MLNIADITLTSEFRTTAMYILFMVGNAKHMCRVACGGKISYCFTHIRQLIHKLLQGMNTGT
jgi:hypothetical protein